jgi:hypothetical protein
MEDETAATRRPLWQAESRQAVGSDRQFPDGTDNRIERPTNPPVKHHWGVRAFVVTVCLEMISREEANRCKAK